MAPLKAQTSDSNKQISEEYELLIVCYNEEREIVYTIYKELISKTENELQQYNIFVSISFTEGLIYTSKMNFKYKFKKDTTGTYEEWKTFEIDWENNLNEIGKKHYLGKSWGRDIKHDPTLHRATTLSEQKISDYNGLSENSIHNMDTIGNSILIVLANFDCVLKIDSIEVANLRAGYEARIRVSEGEYILEAFSLDTEKTWSMLVTITENCQKRIKIHGTLSDNNTSKVMGHKFTDSRDSKIYKTIKIGNQVWMAENLAYKMDSGCWAYDNISDNVDKYGYLYDWDTAQKACPSGWHLPTKNEFETLWNYLGGESQAVYQTLLPCGRSGLDIPWGGFRTENGKFKSKGEFAEYWSSTKENAEQIWRLTLMGFYMSAYFEDNSIFKNPGVSVRCIIDD